MKSLKGILGLMSAAAFVVAALPASAAAIPPLYTGPNIGFLEGTSDTMVIFSGNTEIASVNENTEATQRLYELDNGSSAGILGAYVIVEPQFAGFSDAYILQHPDTWSDLLGDTVFGTVGFISADNLTFADLASFGGLRVGGPFPTVLLETPDRMDLVRLGLLSGGHTGYFRSDVETTSVPDGGLTVALLGFALVGLEGIRRQFKK